MKLIFQSGLFILSLYTVAVQADGFYDGFDYQPVTAEDLKNDENLRNAKQIIITKELNNLKGPHDSKPPELDILDLVYNRQLVAGLLYRFKWTKEQITRFSSGKPKETSVIKVNCKGYYWVKEWEHFAKFNGPHCT